MRLERLVLEAGDRAVSLDLHPRLTVISGVDPVERDGLVNELVGALGRHRSGVHLELELDDGSRLAVFRPSGARHRVVEIDRGIDVSSAFTTSGGAIDLLEKASLDLPEAKRLLRCTSADLAASTHRDELVRRLAAMDQEDLWSCADAVKSTGDRLRTAAEEAGSEPEDVEAVEQVEQRHATLVSAQDDHERVRRLSFFIAVLCTLGAVPLTILEGRHMAMPFVLFASVATMISMVYWGRVRVAQGAESQALGEAGAESYLGFHLERVNSLLANDQARRHLMENAEIHRATQAAWDQIVGGEVDVDWALEHRLEIGAASRLRQDVASTTPHDDAGASTTELVTRLAQALQSRLQAVRSVGDNHLALPLILDEAFDGLDEAVKAPLLEMLAGATDQQQVVFLTNDEQVTAWARLEAMTGALRVIEPRAEVGGADVLDAAPVAGLRH